MFAIKTMNKISPAGLSQFKPGAYSVSDEIDAPDAVLVRSASLHDAVLPDSLKAVARAGAGTNNIPIDKCSEKGIVVFNTPGANANAVKELVIGAFILTCRNVIDASNWVQGLKGKGDEVAKLVEKGKSQFVGPEIAGKKLGVIGLGAIGVMVANTAKSLGMEVYGYDPYISVDAAWGISRSIHHATTVNELYEKCDMISIHVPLNNETRGTINAQSIAAMKNGVRIFNFARGELVVAEDIKAALESGKVASYTVDFPCDELLQTKGVIPVPHLGASTPESEDNCAFMAANELISFLEDGTIKNSVNFPRVELPSSGGTRITVVHKNIPNMVTQITAAFAKDNINIENMVDKSKKENAYTILDISGENIDKCVERLKSIEGVVRVRVIR
ncbi:MAG TPA: phosphoglycerate dehydrogenase [Ruminiclostridium sp.]|nr:phosphoglycerate dehydrogenase [Ruminiclostridium sp.]